GCGDQLDELHVVCGPAVVPLRLDPVDGVAVAVGEVERRREASLWHCPTVEQEPLQLVAAVDLAGPGAMEARPDVSHVGERGVVLDESNTSNLGLELGAELH